jgi:lactoylglutathione lyase
VENQANKIFIGLSHIGIMTDDIEKSNRFYIENLGFSLDFETVMKKPNEQWVKVSMLKLGNLTLEMIELSDKSKSGKGTAGCLNHIAIRVANLDEAIIELKAKGNTFETEQPITIEAIYSGIRFIYIIGPNGERVELIEER